MAGANRYAGWATWMLRLLLVLVLALAAVEYLLDKILRDIKKTPTIQSKQVPLLAVIRNQEMTKDAFKKNSHMNNVNNNVTEKDSQNKEIVIGNITEENSIKLNKTGQDNPVYFANTILIKKIKGVEHMTTGAELKTIASLPLCDILPSGLGPVPVVKTELELEKVEKKYPQMQRGGRYSPPNCTARHKVAIIVPYRDRQQHLAIFLNHIHSYLMKQQIQYGIFIIEQEGNKPFNRAKLFNVGFVESQRLEPGGWQCFILHDIDLLPLDTRNMYSCPKQPRHMSSSIDKFDYISLYDNIFGGVGALTADQFVKVNGFSNKYWGWGGEDMDIFERLEKNNYHIARYKMSIARYIMLEHEKAEPNPKRFGHLLRTSDMLHDDGLSTLKYKLIQMVEYHLYTYVLANIDESD